MRYELSDHERRAHPQRTRYKAACLGHISSTSNRNEPTCFGPHLYRARNLVERFLHKIKQCRRVATRYDEPAVDYFAFVRLTSIRLWLRVNESML